VSEVQKVTTLEAESYLISDKEILIPDEGICVEKPKPSHAPALAELYKHAYERSDYFAERYSNPGNEIFDPEWIVREYENPDHKWFVFTDKEGEVIGSTGFFHDFDSNGAPVMVSDATQITPDGRGKHIMDYFFKKVVPRIEEAGNQLATSFVLTPESKGLRRTLQSELGMIAVGIKPHALKHRISGSTLSEISAIKPKEFDGQPVSILENFAPLYQIVKEQMPELPEPEVSPHVQPDHQVFTRQYLESEMSAGATNIALQRELILTGHRPVEYDPITNSFTMAKISLPKPDLDFIINNESIKANDELVGYLQDYLYKDAGKEV